MSEQTKRKLGLSTTGTKWCYLCTKVKPLDEFNKSPKEFFTRDGHATACTECTKDMPKWSKDHTTGRISLKEVTDAILEYPIQQGGQSNPPPIHCPTHGD